MSKRKQALKYGAGFGALALTTVSQAAIDASQVTSSIDSQNATVDAVGMSMIGLFVGIMAIGIIIGMLVRKGK